MTGTVAGPSGGSGGEGFTDVSSASDGVRLAVIEVRAGTVVDAIRATYSDGSSRVSAPWHGGTGGQLHRVSLRQGEHVVRLHGTYGLHPGFGYVVRSIRIETNRREDALVAGDGGGRRFLYDAGISHEIGGFVGRSGTVLDAVGPILRRLSPASGTELSRCGPTGGVGGRTFNDATLFRKRPDLKVARVVVHADRFVDSISVDYLASDGQLISGPQHGGDGGVEQELTLHPREYITAVSGLYGTLVDRIEISTNRRKRALAAGANFRPFEPRSPFGGFYRYEAPEGTEIVGFFGNSGTFVDTIGVFYRART